MKTLWILLFALPLRLFAQEELPPPPPPSAKMDEKIKNDYCKWDSKYDDKQLMQLAPFKDAVLIKLVSLDPGKPFADSGQVVSLDSSYWIHAQVLPAKDYRDLANVMYNFLPAKSYDPKNTWEERGYQPTQAVLFYNKDQKLIAVTELSYKTNKIRTWPGNTGGEKKCSTALSLYLGLFRRANLDIPNY